MKNYARRIALGVTLITIVGGVVFYYTRHEPNAWLKIGLIVIVITVGLVFYILQLIRRRRDVAAGVPAEDEFTTKAKIFAGSRAFLGSLYLWFFIFVFNSHFSDNEEMLGIGILGSIVIYFACLWYYKTTGKFDEK